MYKDILVYLDGSGEDETRLAYAEALAKSADAHVTGLYCNILPGLAIISPDDAAAATAIAEMHSGAIATGNRVEANLRTSLDQLDVLHELRRLDVVEGQAGHAIAAEARAADIFVATRPYSGQNLDPAIVERVIFDSGRASLLVPPGGTPSTDYKTILIAWRNTREAARALSEAMPLLTRAENVIVACISEGENPEQTGERPGADIARNLDRHGVNVELKQVSGWSDAGKALLNEQKSNSADLVVMGAYGHSRFREWVLGGVTRTLFAGAEVPILVAH